MRVKITRCNNPSRWYADMVGITIAALTLNGDGNFISDLGKIYAEDCEVVPDDDRVFPIAKKQETSGPFTEDELHEIALALHLCTTSDRTKPLIEKVTQMIIALRNKKV